jgi:hypothetical protein
MRPIELRGEIAPVPPLWEQGMRFSLEYLREVLPPPNPPLERVPPLVREFFGASDSTGGGEDGGIIQRSAFWTYAIFSESGGGFLEVTLKFPGPSWSDWWRATPFAVGVLDQEFEGSGFGLIILHASRGTSQIIGEAFFPRLERRFPIVVRSLVEDLHAVPSLTNATSTCWAKDNGASNYWGFITCRHAVTGVKTGATVALAGGGMGNLQRKAPPTIDAAYVSTSAPSASLSRMQMVTFPTAGQSVDVKTSTGSQARSVVAVTNTLGVITDPYHPVKVYLDQPCLPGDSGALVQISGGGGIAIYCGAMSGATVSGMTGQTVGIGQHLEQAVTVLNLSPHI